jgi:hypothetical protein
VINSPIYKELNYQKSAETFHNWNDNVRLYGLNFASLPDANNFSQTVQNAVDLLNNCKYHSPKFLACP